MKPADGITLDRSVLICGVCANGLAGKAPHDTHWFCLKDAIWSEHTPVKVLAYRLLKRLKDQAWSRELLSQIYFDDQDQAWADAEPNDNEENSVVTPPTVDSNGTALAEGDTVTLIKDLDVKGANFTAKRGTTVKNIALTDDPKYVEGRVNGIRIVLVAAYLKKS